jgi:hypothetical protein
LRIIRHQRVSWRKPISFSKAASRTTSSKTESLWIHCFTRKRGRNLESWYLRRMAATLSRGVTVHRAHFAVNLVVAIRVAKHGTRIL